MAANSVAVEDLSAPDNVLPPSRPLNRVHQARFCRIEDGRYNGLVIVPGDTVSVRRAAYLDANDPRDVYVLVENITKNDNGSILGIYGYQLIHARDAMGRDSGGGEEDENELVMLLVVQENDPRPAEVQGMVRIAPEHISGKIHVLYTQNRGTSDRTIRRFCRSSRKSVRNSNRKFYGGEVHNLYRHQLPKKVQGDYKYLLAERQPPIERGERCTLVDVFCGAGGASEGADSAEIQVLAGIERDRSAIEVWERLIPGGIPIEMDVFEFLQRGMFRCIRLGKITILHISPPCQPYAPCHTRPGKNDEENIRCLDAIKPLLEASGAAVVTLENTYGLVTNPEHLKYFNKIIRSIQTAGSGYNVRWTIANFADEGLASERKRLLIIAAKIGYPLPPFPRPTHGPQEHGLEPIVTIRDMLLLLSHHNEHLQEDSSYKPECEKPLNKPPYDNRILLPTIVTSGSQGCYHPSGKRHFTPRELAFIQSMGINRPLANGRTQAIKQIGNSVPPLIAERLFRSCAETMESFAYGFITAEDELHDLNATLIERGVVIPQRRSRVPTSQIDPRQRPESQFIHLDKPRLGDERHKHFTSVFATRLRRAHM